MNFPVVGVEFENHDTRGAGQIHSRNQGVAVRLAANGSNAGQGGKFLDRPPGGKVKLRIAVMMADKNSVFAD